MRNLKFLSAFMLIISLNALAVPEGAFTRLHVKAKDVDKYIALMKKNTAFAILAVCNVDQISPSIIFFKINIPLLRHSN